MIYHIDSPATAERILRAMAHSTGPAIFDIRPDVDAAQVPLVIRKCRDRGHEHEYVGSNIWGRGFDKASTYCPECGYALKPVAEVAIAIQGAVVLETNYRTRDTARSAK